MAWQRSIFVPPDSTAPDARGTTPVEARKALAGLVPNPGVLTGLMVTGTAEWAYTVAAGHIALSRGASDGINLAANDGPVTVTTDPAPGTGSRIDIIYVLQRDVEQAEPDSAIICDVARGVASGTPVAPTLPVGAMEIARATVAATATTTNHAAVTITQTARRTGPRGGIIPVTTTAQRDALNSLATTAAPLYVDLGGAIWRNDGTGWKAPTIPGQPYAVAAGTQNVPFSGSVGTANISFPTGRFTVAPIVTISMGSSTTSRTETKANVRAVTKDLFTVVAEFESGVTGSQRQIWWQAMQMTADSAAG